MRDLKFRAWDKDEKEMYFNFQIWSDGKGETFIGKNWELMQYTGLKDKNEKEIYEGDIIKNISYVTDTEWIERVVDIRFLDKLATQKYDREVIGNIYENPELVK